MFCGVSCQRAYHQSATGAVAAAAAPVSGCLTQVVLDEDEFYDMKKKRGMSTSDVLKDLYETEPVPDTKKQIQVIEWLLHGYPAINREILRVLTQRYMSRVTDEVLRMVIGHNRSAITEDQLAETLRSRPGLLQEYSEYGVLEKAVYDNDIKAVTKLLKKFSWMREKENLIRTALRTKNRNEQMLRILLADPTVVIDQQAFVQAVNYDEPNMLKLLLSEPRSHPEELDNYALDRALDTNKLNMVYLLLQDKRVELGMLKDWKDYWEPKIQKFMNNN